MNLRRTAYVWLQEKMGLSEEDAHIARLDKAQCEQLIELVRNYMEAQGGSA